jgi:hypothetical protein
MKSFVLLVLLSFQFVLANAQQVIGSYPVNAQPPYSEYVSQVCRVNNDCFAAIFPFSKSEDELLFFDSKMKLISKTVVPADEPNSFGKVLYSRMIANNDNVIVVKTIKQKNKSIFTINVSKYKASTGEKIISKDLLKDVEKFGSIFFSKNGDFLGRTITTDNKNDLKFGVEIFSTSDFEKLYSLTCVLTKGEEITSYRLTNDGTFTLLTHFPKEQKFKIHFYDSKGILQKTLTENYKIGPKEELGGHFETAPLQSDSKDVFVFNRYNDDDLLGVDAWEVDYSNQSFKKLFSHNFTDEFIKKDLFKNVYSQFNSKKPSENLIAKPEKGPSGLSYYKMSKLYLNKTDGSLILLYGKNKVKTNTYKSGPKTMYSFEGLIMMSFSQTGQNLWNSVVDTKVYFQGNAASSFYFPNFTGISVVSFDTDESILVLLPEPMGMMNMIYSLREFDKSTGKVNKASTLINEGCFINKHYSAFLNSSTFIGFKMIGANNMKKENFVLQAINF